MNEAPGLRQGIQAPVKIENILEGEEASPTFWEDIVKIVQRKESNHDG